MAKNKRKRVIFAKSTLQQYFELEPIFKGWSQYSSGEFRSPLLYTYSWNKYLAWTNPKSSERLILLFEGNSIIGYALIDFEEYLEEPPMIGEIFILPEKRRRGNGKFLVSEIKKITKDRGCTSLECFSECDEFWISLGFHEVEDLFIDCYSISL